MAAAAQRLWWFCHRSCQDDWLARAWSVYDPGEMRCIACDAAEVLERPELTARGYRRFRCRACGRQFNGFRQNSRQLDLGIWNAWDIMPLSERPVRHGSHEGTSGVWWRRLNRGHVRNEDKAGCEVHRGSGKIARRTIRSRSPSSDDIGF